LPNSKCHRRRPVRRPPALQSSKLAAQPRHASDQKFGRSSKKTAQRVWERLGG
jgi:hypothetical protein